jgi:spore coat polysaccharide biosynthesis protein SpsF
MRTVIVVPARVGSTRLLGKVLLPLAGEPMLYRQIERIRASSLDAQLVVATTDRPSDDPIRALCAQVGARCFSGHPTDLLDRHFRCAIAMRADVIVTVPGDCPLVDPRVIDRVVRRFALGGWDYVSNLHPPTYPDGMNVEVCSVDALAVAQREAKRALEREDALSFLWKRRQRFRTANVTWQTGLDCSATHRFTVDYPDDYRFASAVFDALYSRERSFTLEQILDLMGDVPALCRINGHHCDNGDAGDAPARVISARGRGSL